MANFAGLVSKSEADRGFLLQEAEIGDNNNKNSNVHSAIATANQAGEEFRKSVFDAVNPWIRNGNDVSKQLLEGALTVDGISAEERRILRPLVDSYDAIASTSADDFNRVSWNDLLKMVDIYRNQQLDKVLADKAKAYAEKRFSDIDLNRDGTLSKAELLNSEELATGDNKVLTSYLRQREPDIALLHTGGDWTSTDRGITREDVDAMTASAISDAAIANLYMRGRLQNGRDIAGKNNSFFGEMWAKAFGSYLATQHSSEIKTFINKTAPASEGN